MTTPKRKTPAKRIASTRRPPAGSTATGLALTVRRASETTAKTARLTRGIQMAGEEKLLELRREEVPTSWSALIEVALLELFKRSDFVAVVERHAIGLRRK